MKKAFIFDMDGVLISSEQVWVEQEGGFLTELLGERIRRQVGDLIGVSVKSTYERARELGLSMPRAEFRRRYDAVAFAVYDRAPVTPGIDELAGFLTANGFRLGLVSSSPASWIGRALERLSLRGQLEAIVSLNERTDLKPKPDPAGYVEAMRMLGCSATDTVILEDSNLGIAAARTSGAYTIALTQNLVKGYRQNEADAKAETMKDVVAIVEKYLDGRV